MNIHRPIYHLLKVTLEAESVHAIHTGQSDGQHDTLILRDANGLPTLSGTSLAGIIRREYEYYFGESATDDLFGYVKTDKESSSWLNISWAFTHLNENLVLEGLQDISEQNITELYHLLQSDKPIIRDRVALNDRGSAKPAGKFDVSLVPAGARYSFWISYWGKTQSRETSTHCKGNDVLWNNIIALLQQSKLRIGHGTNNGYGLFKVHKMHAVEWDLRLPNDATELSEDILAFQNRNRSRTDIDGLTEVTNLKYPSICINDTKKPIDIKVPLVAETYWRIGGGKKNLKPQTGNAPKLLPMHEQKVVWCKASDASISEPQYVLPGSSIAGALRHRVAFYHNCLEGRFINGDADKQPLDTDKSEAVRAIFGYAEKTNAVAGKVSISDVYINSQTKTQDIIHHKKDSFTGGAINGALYTEQALWKTPNINVCFYIDRPQAFYKLANNIKIAFVKALTDFATGKLSIGSESAKGYGAFLWDTDKDTKDPTKIKEYFEKKLLKTNKEDS